KWHLFHEVQTHHHHAGDPEEDDVEARHQGVGWVVALELRCLVRPTERREWPQRRREPGVEHVLVAPDGKPPWLAALLRGVDVVQGLLIVCDDDDVFRPDRKSTR